MTYNPCQWKPTTPRAPTPPKKKTQNNTHIYIYIHTLTHGVKGVLLRGAVNAH